MSNVDAFGCEFLGDGGGESTHGEFGRCEAAHLCIGFHGGGGSSEDEGRWMLSGLVFGMFEEVRQAMLGENQGSLAVLIN